MSYDYKERSNHDGEPLTLYEFSIAVTESDGSKSYGVQAWRYTSQEVDTTYDGVLYEAVPIEDSGSAVTGEITNDEFVVTMPASLDLPLLYRAAPPSEPIYLTVRRKHQTDDEAPIYWVGTVYSVGQVDDITTKIKCRMLTASFDRNGLRLTWSRNCPHSLYDESCTVNPASWRETLAITALTGVVVKGAELANKIDGYYSGGYLEWETFPDVFERRAIESHSGNSANIMGVTDGLSVGMNVSIYPGCDRSTGSRGCGRFNNLPNYGGFPHMPGKSPFDGTPVFY